MSAEVVALSEMVPGSFGDTFAVLASKDEARTKDDKPYYRVSFRDSGRSVSAMIWSDHGHFADCRDNWTLGEFYKIRGRYSESSYGPQIDIDRIRPIDESDRGDGFDPDSFFPVSRYDRDEMFDELLSIAQEQISDEQVQQLVVGILTEFSDGIKRHSAAARNHHAFIGGYLEHTLSVTRTAVFIADKYTAYYTRMEPPLSKSLVVAGAILHDIGKLEELEFRPEGWVYTARGRLVGHILMGRDLVIKKAEQIPDFDPETLLRLEHIIIAHQNLPEWGSPIAPHTPEAMLVHFADDMDAKIHELAVQLEMPKPDGEEFTSRQNPLRRMIFRGLNRDGDDAATASKAT